jgi:Cytochrome P450.
MAHNIVSGEKRMLLMPYGDAWRRQRKIMYQVLNSSQQGIFKPFQDLESKALMYQLLIQPEIWYLWLGRFSNSVIMSVIFGRRTDPGDANLSAVYQAQEEFVPYMMPGASILDAFPILAKLSILKSLQPWRRKGDDLYRRTTR